MQLWKVKKNRYYNYVYGRKLDAGDILTQVEVEIEERETTGSLFDKLSEAGAHLLSKTVPLLIQGKLEPIKQNEEEVTFAYNIKREQEN